MNDTQDELKYLAGQIAALQILAASHVVSLASTAKNPEEVIRNFVDIDLHPQDELSPASAPDEPFSAGMTDSLKRVLDAALSMQRGLDAKRQQ